MEGVTLDKWDEGSDFGQVGQGKHQPLQSCCDMASTRF